MKRLKKKKDKEKLEEKEQIKAEEKRELSPISLAKARIE